MRCKDLVNTTLKDFYKQNKDIGDALIISKRVVLIKLVVGNYYGIIDSNNNKTVVKCLETSPRLVFLSESGIPGPINIIDFLWEKSPEEMFKPDCCNG